MATESALLVELETPPPSDSITLLLKCHKSTVLISVPPDASFSKVKQLLLAALQARQISTIPGSEIPLPTNADDLELAVLKDKKDFTKGWVTLEPKEQDVADNKSAKRKGGYKKGSSDSPAGVGLSDGSQIAYRIKPTKEEPDDDEDTMSDILEDPGWDVLFPAYDEDDTAG